MKYWCKKHKRSVTNDEAQERCLKENDNKGCVNLIRKRRRKKTSGPKPLCQRQPSKGELPIEEKILDRMEFVLYRAGLLPINDKTGEGTILRKMIDDQWRLFQCLQSVRAEVGLVLRSRKIIEGSLYKVWGLGYNKIRVKVGESSDSEYGGIFVDTWPQEVIATKFKVATDFRSIGFLPYQEKQVELYEVWRSDLDKTEHDLFWDRYDLFHYLRHGKYCVDEVRITLTNGIEFTGSLELVRTDRILLSLVDSDKFHTYLDFHPLMVSAVRFEVGSKGWPYDPREC
jgi:hypothetical protein